jgi:glycosyltransferase involved in cell wall biosynthesis
VNDVTVLVLVPNAKDRLPRCLESIAWARDRFCVVDTKTNDGSDEIARRYTDHVVVHEYENAAAQRNWAIPQITTEWTLVLDADEWVSDELALRIQQVIVDPASKDGYSVKRNSYFFGKLIRFCGWQNDYNLRLFRTKKGKYAQRRVHSFVAVDGTTGQIDEPMFHDTYRDFDEYFRTFQRFTTWSAEDLVESGHRVSMLDLIAKPAFRFFKMFVIRRGFLDGYHGAVLCGLAACSVFTKYAKAWNLQRLAAEANAIR